MPLSSSSFLREVIRSRQWLDTFNWWRFNHAINALLNFGLKFYDSNNEVPVNHTYMYDTLYTSITSTQITTVHEPIVPYMYM